MNTPWRRTSQPPEPDFLDRVRTWAELVRLPNVFTALADALMGFLFVRPYAPEDQSLLAALLAASGLFYAAGMVLNDVFDHRIDLEERPERPIPSGRVAQGTARRLGIVLLAGGILASFAAGHLAGLWRIGLVGLGLAIAVISYDAWLKRTPLGPVNMGACRALNVLLGMSAATEAWQARNWVVAAAIGLYVVGITWFARREARWSGRWSLAGGLAMMLAGIGLLASLLRWSDDFVPLLMVEPGRWYTLMGLLAALIGWRCVRAIIRPSPSAVRAAVTQAILSIVMLDAAACFAVRDLGGAIAVCVLLVPATMLQQWVPST